MITPSKEKPNIDIAYSQPTTYCKPKLELNTIPLSMTQAENTLSKI